MKRYLPLLLMLLLLSISIYWSLQRTSSPAPTASAPQLSSAPPPPTTAPSSATQEMDPSELALANELHSDSSSPQRDLEIIHHFIDLYRRVYKQGNPIGENADITAALTGQKGTPQPAQLFPRDHQAIRAGLLHDRWGSPYWFHPESAHRVEIRSPGPDKELFTADDIFRHF
jgi:hypothetical protein